MIEKLGLHGLRKYRLHMYDINDMYIINRFKYMPKSHNSTKAFTKTGWKVVFIIFRCIIPVVFCAN